MTHRAKLIPWLWWLFLAGLVAPGAALASMGSVTAVPGTANVAVGRTNTVYITWQVTRLQYPGFCGSTVSSPSGQLTSASGGTVYQTVPVLLTQTQVCSGPAGTPTPFTFRETLQVPASVIAAALRQGQATLRYTRTFSDGFSNSTASVTLAVTGSAGAGFSLSRLALSFDNESTLGVVKQDTRLRALADLSYNGSGYLQGVWEIASPESTAGTPVYRPLKFVSEFIGAGGEVILRSPRLPSAQTGLYLVRLRITQPAPFFETPVLSYFVIQRPVTQPPPVTIRLTTPFTGAHLAADTTFAWSPVHGAAAYQIEFYPSSGLPALTAPRPRAPHGRRVTGMLLPAKQTAVALSALVRSHLKRGDYRWRVIALGAGGRIIGRSAPRSIYVP